MELKNKKLLKKEKFQPKIDKQDSAVTNVFEFINKTLTKGICTQVNQPSNNFYLY